MYVCMHAWVLVGVVPPQVYSTVFSGEASHGILDADIKVGKRHDQQSRPPASQPASQQAHTH